MAKKRGRAKSAKAVSVAESSASVANAPSMDNSIKTQAIAAALSSINPPVLMKVCRLCENKDGPFLNIFDPETLTAKKTQDLMPFVIAEYDDLPHKICFRCSAKVEELHEFVQKCIRTQESLRKALGRSGPKTQSSKLWEEKLHKSNISNDDICDALIKKAMAGIEDLPLKPMPLEEKKPIQYKNKKLTSGQTEQENNEDDDDSDLPLNEVSREIEGYNTRTTRQEQTKSKKMLDKPAEKIPLDSLKNKKVTRGSESSNDSTSISCIQLNASDDESLQTRLSRRKAVSNKPVQNKPAAQTQVAPSKTNVISSESDDSDTSIKIKLPEQINKEAAQLEAKKIDKNFDIMDHVSMIKVNGVGVLFQCKLCNRNFLKKEVVLSHACSKSGVPKIDFTKNLVPPEPPKVTTVKYINTRIDGDIRRPVAAPVQPPVKPPTIPTPSPPPPPPPPPQPEVKPTKPKVGPASKVKRGNPAVGMVVTPRESTPEPRPVAVPPSVEFPTLPNLKSRYKLVPGPNNTFTLMEDAVAAEPPAAPAPAPVSVPIPRLVQKQPLEIRSKLTQIKPNEVPRQIISMSLNMNRQLQSQVIDLDVAEEITPHVSNVSNTQPYPVGLFQTVPQASNNVPAPVITQPVPFTTPAMKKQSYTIVKTGNPSKLLISTKPQPPEEEPPKKKSRKSKIETRAVHEEGPTFNLTLDDSARQKDNGFFTFINVDPLLQPSYVLPTDNIIQESQISTSTPQSSAANAVKDNYACNMCSEKFSREKKLLAHIQSHYSKMDEEDQLREKNVKKRGRRS